MGCFIDFDFGEIRWSKNGKYNLFNVMMAVVLSNDQTSDSLEQIYKSK